MPVGAIGEILIEGPIVGKGYHNNKSLTRASYVSGISWLEVGHEGRFGRSSTVFKDG